MIEYKCSCGKTFTDAEIEVESWEEYRGECFGVPAYETMYEDRCPYCGSIDFEEYMEDEDDL